MLACCSLCLPHVRTPTLSLSLQVFTPGPVHRVLWVNACLASASLVSGGSGNCVTAEPEDALTGVQHPGTMWDMYAVWLAVTGLCPDYRQLRAGDTVNTASRMESTGQPGCIQASATTYSLLQGEPWRPTGGVMAKGKGNQAHAHVAKYITQQKYRRCPNVWGFPPFLAAPKWKPN
jgi:hypothetical protein